MYNSIELEIKKWGNSLGLRLSKPLAELLNLKEGSRVLLTLKENRAELRVIDETGTLLAPPYQEEVKEPEVGAEDRGEEGDNQDTAELKTRKRPRPSKRLGRKKERFYRLEKINLRKMPGFETPLYNDEIRGRKTPLPLKNGNLQEILERYPFVVVVFWDFLYLDFYDSVRRKINFMKRLAALFQGHCWVVIVNTEEYPALRQQYVGNAWSELELRGYVNGRKLFEGYSLENLTPVIQAVSGKYLTKAPLLKLEEVLRAHDTQGIRSEEELMALLDKHQRLVICFQLPGDKATSRRVSRAAGKLDQRPHILNSYDFAYIDRRGESFRENPLKEKFKIRNFPTLLLLKQGPVGNDEGEDQLEIIEERLVDGSLTGKELLRHMREFFFGEDEGSEDSKEQLDDAEGTDKVGA
jgi:hypothetical protein